MSAMFSHLTASSVWFLLGATGATLFYSRFLVQWLVSERAGRCVVPVSFWYLSSAGTLALLVYALAIRSPLGALGQCFNIVVYTRNLVHIGRKRGSLTPLSSSLLQGVAAVVAVVAIVLSTRLWLQELHLYPGQHGITTPTTALWLVLGLIGQILFALRFLIQWIATERSGESTVPAAFWHLSVVASILQVSCFVQRGEWVFATGMAVTIFIYARNLALLSAPDTEKRPAA